MIKKLSVLAVLIFLLGCKNDDDQTATDSVNEQNSITLVTGVALRQYIQDLPLVYGNPNTKNNGVFIEPNPSNGIFNVLSMSSGNITDIWIVPGNTQKIYQNVDFQSALEDVSYQDSELTAVAVNNTSGINSTNITINAESFSQGYYRVFVKTTNGLSWENLFLNSDGNTSIQDIEAFWK